MYLSWLFLVIDDHLDCKFIPPFNFSHRSFICNLIILMKDQEYAMNEVNVDNLNIAAVRRINVLDNYDKLQHCELYN